MVGLGIHLVVVNLYVQFQRRNLVRRHLCYLLICVEFLR
jgi:hypothetical protein